MKEDLVKLIEDTEQIKTKFHSTGGQGLHVHNVIYDNADFTLWKREVQLEFQCRNCSGCCDKVKL